jgi:hypothetical protein
MKRVVFAALCAAIGTSFCDIASARNVAMSPYCQGIYFQYSNMSGPKAFAMGSDGSCWWGRRGSVGESRSFAVNACRRNHRRGCHVVDSSR